MPPRKVIVPSNSAILRDPTTKRLHEYQNGEVLVETEAVTPETGDETPVSSGLKIQGVGEDILKKSHESLKSFKPKDVIVAYIALKGPADSEVLRKIDETGIERLVFQPNYAYRSKGTVAAFNKILKEDLIEYVYPITPDMKPTAVALESGSKLSWIIVQADPKDIDEIIKEFDSFDGVEVVPNQEIEKTGFFIRILADVNGDGYTCLKADNRVVSIEDYEEVTPDDEVADLILAGQYSGDTVTSGSYLQWLDDHAANGQGVTIGIVDMGIDVNHIAFKDRIVDLSGGRKSWHGTMVAGHAAGSYLPEKDENGFIYGVGVAPAAEILSQSNSNVSSTPAAVCKETVSQTGPSKNPGSVQNNSWGIGTKDPMDYGSLEASYDMLVRNADPDSPTPKPLTICFSTGNSGRQGLTRPKAAKNIIVTGNSQNYRPHIGGSESNNINEIYWGSHASSCGNCGDGRIKPDVVAPGEWTASANYDSLPNQPEYISDKLTWGGGSSGASPKTAGVCALLIQWWRRHDNGNNPSPAMLRALIVNGAEPMAGANSIPPIPSNIQGWGRLNVKNILSEDVHHTYVDQTKIFKNRGDKWVCELQVSDPTKPVKITLSWTDPMGNIGTGTESSPAIVNKLLLTVGADGTIYKGNNFQNGWSISGELSDPAKAGWDNLQNVYLQPKTSRNSVRVTVEALDINTNCLTSKLNNPQQDFALVITNAFPSKNSTPADVFIAIDENASKDEKKDKPSDFWASGSDDNDSAELTSSVVDSADEDITDKETKVEEKNDKEDEWWNKKDEWPKVEGERAGSFISLLENKQFVSGLDAGLNIMGSSKEHRVYTSSTEPLTEHGGDTAALNPVENESNITISNNFKKGVSQPLSNALMNLMANWNKFGSYGLDDGSFRRRAAVIVVGSGTRITRQDLNAMRRLSFMGELLVISDNSNILAFLAQRIYRKQGIRFTLATDARDLAHVVRDSLADISGGTQVYIESTYNQTDENLNSRHTCDVTAYDSRLLVHVYFQPEYGIPSIMIKKPKTESPFLITPESSYEGIHIAAKDDRIEICISSPKDDSHWAGRWEFQLSQAGHPKIEPTVWVWAWGSLKLNFHRDISLAPEADAGDDKCLVRVSSNEGVKLSDTIIVPQIIGSEMPMDEDVRNITMSVRSSRLDSLVPVSEITRESDSSGPGFYSPSISTWLDLPRPTIGARILDLHISSKGIDDLNNVFARTVRTNLIDLQPRSLWRKRIAQDFFFVSGQVKEVNYEKGNVTSIILEKGERQRLVKVNSPVLAEQLAKMDLSEPDLHFGVEGSNLEAIMKVLY